MADMYGAVRSNVFQVKDVEVFKKWFTEEVRFGHQILLWCDEKGVSFGGYEQYPSAMPRMPGEGEPWELESFAAAVREHLQDGEEFRVLAAGHEKLRYVAAGHLVVTADSVTFTDLYEGN